MQLTEVEMVLQLLDAADEVILDVVGVENARVFSG
jgi:hypothetical protein